MGKLWKEMTDKEKAKWKQHAYNTLVNIWAQQNGLNVVPKKSIRRQYEIYRLDNSIQQAH